MTRAEIITLARQAGIDWTDDVFFVVNAPEMERFAQLLVESTLEKNNLTWVANCQHLVTAEREECAKLAEAWGTWVGDGHLVAAAIRSRGQQ